MGRAFARLAMDCELLYPGKDPEDRILSGTRAARLERIKAFPPAGSLKEGWTNLLIRGDNLPVLKTLITLKDKGSLCNGDGTPGVRLVYMDPPFSTGLRFRKGGMDAYDDRTGGSEFIEMLRKRLVLLRGLLSEDSSVYLHLDWKKAHYMKVVMDEVFGSENFLNDIIWNYGGRGAKATSRQFPRNHDIILLYGKRGRIFNKVHAEKRFLKGAGNGFKRDGEGRWFKTSPRGDYTDESVRRLAGEGRIYRTRNGRIRIKYFLREEGRYLVEEKPLGDVWDDIPDGMHLPEAEKTGYPTQKPEALLSRIINASANPGDLVLDPFAGSGTTLAAAEKLGRRWIGIDSGSLAVRTAERRLLGIRGTRSLSGKGRYSEECAPFAVMKAVID